MQAWSRNWLKSVLITPSSHNLSSAWLLTPSAEPILSQRLIGDGSIRTSLKADKSVQKRHQKDQISLSNFSKPVLCLRTSHVSGNCMPSQSSPPIGHAYDQLYKCRASPVWWYLTMCPGLVAKERSAFAHYYDVESASFPGHLAGTDGRIDNPRHYAWIAIMTKGCL
jgi:hypothetical protein